MYWIIGIIVLIVGLYLLNKRNPATNNIASRYYALKDIFGNNDEIMESQYLEMAGVFSQIIYIRNGKMSVDEIREQAHKAVESESGTIFTDDIALTRFCIRINQLIYEINGFSTMDAMIKVIEEGDFHAKSVNKIKKNGYSKMSFKSTYNYISQFPGCLSGDYGAL